VKRKRLPNATDRRGGTALAIAANAATHTFSHRQQLSRPQGPWCRTAPAKI